MQLHMKYWSENAKMASPHYSYSLAKFKYSNVTQPDDILFILGKYLYNCLGHMYVLSSYFTHMQTSY